ncbi:MAG: hypothetical protein HY544_00620 [Candidatus Diapherotrites archaeon]|uniref:Uncharacterized protein n=1 Tax=Candidatus Iainarchaeum sp. TaxID=3101447 RepID=A0A8T3YL09_9ARCH|nr:hypothetical protein [Candidatus Diapherotrites archaeon]
MCGFAPGNQFFLGLGNGYSLMPLKSHFIRFGRTVVAFGKENDLPRIADSSGKRNELHVKGLNYLYPSARSVFFRGLAEAGFDSVKVGAIKGLLNDVFPAQLIITIFGPSTDYQT